MYHIPDDKRAYKSAELICSGLVTCLDKKDLSQITVTDIWKASFVSRATFYRLFDNVTDVLVYQSEKIISNIAEDILEERNHTVSFEELITYIFKEAMSHENVLETISSMNRFDIIYHALMKKIAIFRNAFLDGTDVPGFDEECFLRTIFSLIPVYIDIWIKSEKKKSAQELYGHFQSCINKLNQDLVRAGSFSCYK